MSLPATISMAPLALATAFDSNPSPMQASMALTSRASCSADRNDASVKGSDAPCHCARVECLRRVGTMPPAMLPALAPGCVGHGPTSARLVLRTHGEHYRAQIRDFRRVEPEGAGGIEK